jgi:AhpC/TSA family.
MAFIASNALLIRNNLILKNELEVARTTITKLQKTAFHDNVVGGSFSPPAEIVLYNHPPSANASAGKRAQVSPVKQSGADTTPGLSLLDLKETYLGKDAQSAFTLFVFFSPTDCPACLQEASIWQKLSADESSLKLKVIGIMNHSDQREGEQFLKQLQITFPVLFDNTASLKGRYHIGETPEKVLVDSKGNTLLIQPGSKTAEEKRAFEESVIKLVTDKGAR